MFTFVIQLSHVYVNETLCVVFSMQFYKMKHNFYEDISQIDRNFIFKKTSVKRGQKLSLFKHRSGIPTQEFLINIYTNTIYIYV